MRVYGPLSGMRRLKYGVLDNSGREVTYCPDPKRPYIKRSRLFGSVAAAERFIAAQAAAAARVNKP